MEKGSTRKKDLHRLNTRIRHRNRKFTLPKPVSKQSDLKDPLSKQSEHRVSDLGPSNKRIATDTINLNSPNQQEDEGWKIVTPREHPKKTENIFKSQIHPDPYNLDSETSESVREGDLVSRKRKRPQKKIKIRKTSFSKPYTISYVRTPKSSINITPMQKKYSNQEIKSSSNSHNHSNGTYKINRKFPREC